MWIRSLAGASVLSVATALACGHTYDGVVVETDAGAIDAANAPTDAGSDVAPVPVRCDGSKPFGAPVRVPGLPDNTQAARFSDDESIVYYNIGNDDLRTSTLKDGVYGTGSAVVVAGDSRMPSLGARFATFSADRATLFYEGSFRVWQEGGPAGGPYSATTQLDGTHATAIGVPYFDFRRGLLYADYHLDSSYFYGAIRIGSATVVGASVSAFNPVPLGFNDESYDAGADAGGSIQDRNAVVSADGLEIFFASNRATPTPQTYHDIFRAHRDTIEQPFHDPGAVTGLNSAYIDAPTWISPDGCRLYFHSTRAQPPSIYATYVATREP